MLYARNANTRLHPASLTKMMTLYIAFQAVENDTGKAVDIMKQFSIVIGRLWQGGFELKKVDDHLRQGIAVLVEDPPREAVVADLHAQVEEHL